MTRAQARLAPDGVLLLAARAAGLDAVAHPGGEAPGHEEEQQDDDREDEQAQLAEGGEAASHSVSG